MSLLHHKLICLLLFVDVVSHFYDLMLYCSSGISNHICQLCSCLYDMGFGGIRRTLRHHNYQRLWSSSYILNFFYWWSSDWGTVSLSPDMRFFYLEDFHLLIIIVLKGKLITWILKFFRSCHHQVTESSWLNDMRDQIEHTRVLNVVYRSATALGSHLPRVAVAGALLRPVSSSTQVTSS